MSCELASLKGVAAEEVESKHNSPRPHKQTPDMLGTDVLPPGALRCEVRLPPPSVSSRPPTPPLLGSRGRAEGKGLQKHSGHSTPTQAGGGDRARRVQESKMAAGPGAEQATHPISSLANRRKYGPSPILSRADRVNRGHHRPGQPFCSPHDGAAVPYLALCAAA
ncbi:hypothetical protein NDU88_002012 [Pleurodeles waltl]|uniref:Uncharacterized protein n=1 Tax=Pleurodeles waltl TaxID=8319 RepID=A0AAV7NFW5_PLEWA|nr:hypothetical protein NDU88_002012 [Pleurodeles waltl]